MTSSNSTIIKVPVLFLILFIYTACATNHVQHVNSGNPLFGGQWYADPEVVIFGNSYWVFPTISQPHAGCVYVDGFSSPDLVNWTRHERLIDTAMISWAHSSMWAPAAVENNGRYFLFFGANDIQRPISEWWNPDIHSINDVGGIGIAVADKPEGPYADYLGKPLIGEVYNGAQPIDQFVFKAPDGQWYIVYGGWGRCNICRLNKDFTHLEPYEDGELYREITPEGYVEGPVLFQKDNIWYFMWSEGNWTQGNYRVAYGMSENMFGPFERLGTILQTDSMVATGAGHHSVLNLPGTDEWYIFYHRRPIPNEGSTHRVVCADRMYFDGEGKIMPVKMTFEGVEKRELK